MNIKNLWNVSIPLMNLIMRTFVGTHHLNILIFLRVLGKAYCALWVNMEQSDGDIHVLQERNRNTVNMCNIWLQVKKYGLIRLYFWMFAIGVYLINDPLVQLLFYLFFKLFLQGVFLILHISLTRYVMRVTGIVYRFLWLWVGYYSKD